MTPEIFKFFFIRKKTMAGVNRTMLLKGLISIFIAHGKLDEFRFDLLAGLQF